jgi:glycerol-3-phosphate acyltransferase PlsX
MKPLVLALSEKRKATVRASIVHTDQVIGMEDSIRAVRTKPAATINLGCQMAARAFKEGIEPAAFVSAGNSGAMMASALVHMGRLKNVERPAIAVKLPTLSPNGCVLLDVGANVDCKPEHLRDFAVMGALFAQVERRSPELPRVGLLSNGEERSKGNELTRAALALIDPLACFQPGAQAVGRFVGYSEGKEIFKGQVDVAVTDGFVGNIMLKALEGLGSAVVTILKREAKSNVFTPLGFVLAAAAFRRLKRKLDYAEYGAAPLLGVAGYAFICHGRSNPKAMKNALLRAHSALQERLVERLELALAANSKSY